MATSYPRTEFSPAMSRHDEGLIRCDECDVELIPAGESHRGTRLGLWVDHVEAFHPDVATKEGRDAHRK